MPAGSIRSMYFALACVCLLVQWARAEDLNAAGSQFLSDAYAEWGKAYERVTGVRLRYASLGSAAGIARLRNRTVTFATSAVPLKASELKAGGLVQFPIAIGGVVPVANVPGVMPGALILNGPTLGRIFAGRITRWDDPSIRALNPTLSLPAQRIVLVYATSNSGVHFLFSSYLTEVSDVFRVWSRPSNGPAKLRVYPRTDVGAVVEKTVGALSYVEFARAQSSKLAAVRLVNRDGNVIAPSAKSFRAAAANADWRKLKGYYTVLTNQRGAESWPITGASFALMQAEVTSGLAAGEALRFFDWAYNRGSAFAEEFDFVPLSAAAIAAVQQTWRTSILNANRPLWLVK